MNIRNIDLNLLTVFRSLMKTSSVSKTAEEMNLSQPAVSHALSRLRQNLSDDLLVRSSRSMVPTPYARELEVKVAEMLDQLESVLIRKAFDPKTAIGQVRIQSTEYFEQLILPNLLRVLSHDAPQIKIISTSVRTGLPRAELSDGSSDIALAGFFGDLPEGFYQQNIFKERFVCLTSAAQTGAKNSKISMTEYLKLKHVYISQEGNLTGVVDKILKKHKKQREVVASIAGFAGPAWICQSTGSACTLPERLAKLYSKILPLKYFELPFEMPPIQIVQVWHERTQRDPLLKFVRNTIAQVCSKI